MTGREEPGREEPGRDAPSTPQAILGPAGPEDLIARLLEDGRQVIAPVARDGAVVYDRIEGPDDLARGWTVEAGPGRYRLSRRGDAFFDHVIGPTPWKRFLHPPRETLYRMSRAGGSITVETPDPPADRFAFVGVRPCDLAAIGVLDRVMTGGAAPDRRYAARRANTLIVAVDCRVSAETCFCASMGSGPRAGAGYDLALSELGRGAETRFLVATGSPAGAALLARLATTPASDRDLQAARDGAADAARGQSRRIDLTGLPEAVRAAAEHPRWDDVAERCLTCANCTMVCPTCFCASIEEVSDLAGETAERRRRWDSCFTLDFSHLQGGPARASPKARYRQWLTHKLGTWPEQFDGDLGCTGCGRCIAWCPVGIDLTKEVGVLREPRP